MNTVTRIKMDIGKPNLFLSANAVQGDSYSRSLMLTLYNGISPWIIPDGVTAAVRYAKPDRTKGYYDTMPDGTRAWSTQGNALTIQLAPQMLTVAGNVKVQIELIQGTHILSTFTITVYVEENPAAGILKSENYVNWLQWMLDQSQEQVQITQAAAEAAQHAANVSSSNAQAISTALQEAKSSASEAASFAQSAETACKDVAEIADDVTAIVAGNTAYTKEESDHRYVHSIISAASGNLLALPDSTFAPLQQLKIFGKTIQNNTPAPEAPADLINIGNDGHINLRLLNKNLICKDKFPSSTTKNGVTFVNNGDGSFNISGTATVNTSFTLDWNTNGSVITDLLHRGGRFVFSCDKMAYHNTVFNCTISYRYEGNLIYIFSDGKPHNVPAGAEYSNTGIWIPSGGTVASLTNAHLQLEYGNTATEYVPYKEQTLILSTPNGLPGIPVTSGGNYTDENGQQWICDEIDLSRGVYVQRIVQYTFTGNEGFQTATYCNWVTLASLGLSLGKVKVACCNWFRFSTTNVNSVQTPGGFDFFYSTSDWVTPQQVRFDNSLFATADALKSALKEAYEAGNPMYCHFILEQPAESILSAEELDAYSALHTNYPNTTLLNDGGAGMEVSYVTDLRRYIDNRLEALVS